MAKYYASNPVDGLAPLRGENLMEAIEDAGGRDWKFTDGSVAIVNGEALPVAWFYPLDCTWTLTPPVGWLAGRPASKAEVVQLVPLQ